MRPLVMKGVIRNGRVEVAEPINLPDGSEVTVTSAVNGHADEDRPPTPSEIAATLAAMAKVEPFDMTEEDRAAADAWEKKVNAYGIATMDQGIEDVLP